MRSKRFLSALGLIVAALFVLAPAAGAQEGESDNGHSAEAEQVFHQAEEILHANDANEADVECVELILVENQTVADCRDAPNPLLPETNEIVWASIGFVVVLLFLWRFGFPAAKKAMEERTAKIQGDIDAAEQAKADAEAVKAEYEAKVADAKSESARIIEEARQAADQLKADQQARLNEELAQARANAQADIDAAKGRAMDELRAEVSEIAIGAAEHVVGANLDRNAQIQLIEDYINRVRTSGQG